MSTIIQSNVAQNAVKKYAGQIDTFMVGNSTNLTLNSGSVGFGIAVARDGEGCKPFGASTDVLAGFSIREHLNANAYDGDVITPYKYDGRYKDVAVRNFGYIAVKTETDVTRGADVFVRFAAGDGGTVLGAVRADDDKDAVTEVATAVKVNDVIFDESAKAGDIVRIALTKIF